MAADCPQVQYATKEVSRHMATPTEAAHDKMKKLARYIAGCQVNVFEYRWQDEEEAQLQTCTDSDWAGYTRTRRSTSGGAIVLGSHTRKTWSVTQPVVGMSERGEGLGPSTLKCWNISMFKSLNVETLNIFQR